MSNRYKMCWKKTENGRKKCYVHRVVWEKTVGKIPEGFEIHHIDGNRFNNDISNLICLPHDDHEMLHQASVSEEFEILGRWMKHWNLTEE